MDIGIVADSIACLTKEQIEDHHLKIVPANIFFNGHVYRDFVDISPAKAYELLAKAPEFWKTSAPAPDDYLRVYRELGEKARRILVVTISLKLSGFFRSAQEARDIFAEESPQTVVEVLDSGTAAAAEGLIVLAAARAASAGKTFDEVVSMARKVKERVKFVGLLETIRHVYRTGRIPKVASDLGSILSIRPLLTSSNGGIHFAAAARSKVTGVQKMLRIMRNQVGKLDPVHVAVMHADVLEEAKKLKEKVAAEFNCVELFITDFSPVMGYATGRGTLALAYYKDF
jgi:DegV family protein with EDD domain